MANKNAYDYVKNEITYERPLFNFPDLSSENGNPFHFWPIVHSKLNELGFKKEAKFFGDRMGFMQYRFEEIIQLVAYFLDFNPEHELSNKNNIVNEDEQYVYLKVKKELYHPEKNLKQPTLFKIKDVETFKDMVDSEDFSLKNCYGRTFLHYINEPVLMHHFLAANKQQQWIDLIDLDNFNSSYLHSVSNLECFAILFKHMSEEDSYLTDRFLFGNDVFNNSGYANFIKLLSEKTFHKQSFIHTFSDEETIYTLSKIMICLQKVNPEEFEFLKNQFSTNDIVLSHLKDNEVIQKNIDKMFLNVKLENKLALSDNKQSLKNSRNKI